MRGSILQARQAINQVIVVPRSYTMLEPVVKNEVLRSPLRYKKNLFFNLKSLTLLLKTD